MILTAGEREKFAIYLEQRAWDQEKLAEQLRMISNGEIMARRYHREAEAMRIVAEMLRRTETVEVKGEEEKT